MCEEGKGQSALRLFPPGTSRITGLRLGSISNVALHKQNNQGSKGLTHGCVPSPGLLYSSSFDDHSHSCPHLCLDPPKLPRE